MTAAEGLRSCRAIQTGTGKQFDHSSAFGIDPFQSEEDKIGAETEFNSLYFDLGNVFNYTVNEHYRYYQDCVTDLINITRRCA